MVRTGPLDPADIGSWSLVSDPSNLSSSNKKVLFPRGTTTNEDSGENPGQKTDTEVYQ